MGVSPGFLSFDIPSLELITREDTSGVLGPLVWLKAKGASVLPHVYPHSELPYLPPLPRDVPGGLSGNPVTCV